MMLTPIDHLNGLGVGIYLEVARRSVGWMACALVERRHLKTRFCLHECMHACMQIAMAMRDREFDVTSGPCDVSNRVMDTPNAPTSTF